MSDKLYWHKQQEVVLKKWAETASSYRYLHDRSFQKIHQSEHVVCYSSYCSKYYYRYC